MMATVMVIVIVMITEKTRVRTPDARTYGILSISHRQIPQLHTV